MSRPDTLHGTVDFREALGLGGAANTDRAAAETSQASSRLLSRPAAGR